MTVVVASNNPNKIREIKAILAPLGWEVLSQREAGVHVAQAFSGTGYSGEVRHMPDFASRLYIMTEE